MRFVLTLGLAALLLPLTAAKSEAAIVTFSATLTGAQANAGAGTGSTGTGSAIVTLDDVTGLITLNGTFSGLGSNTTNAHIHGPAAPGFNGGVLVPMTFTAGATSGVMGVNAGTMLPVANIPDMIAGNTYINLHTVGFGGGEIRGQLTAVPEPSSMGLLGLVGMATFLRRRRA